MTFLYQKGIYCLYLAIFLFSCSTTEQIQVSQKTEEVSEIQIKLPEESFSLDGSEIAQSDSINLKNEVAGKLELARQHYLLGQEAIEDEDSASAIKEFETAIKILDELSYFPEIDKNEQFTEISNSLKNDYEELIASKEELNIDSPVSTLREKIDNEVEMIDLKTEKIPVLKEIPKTTVEMEINEKVQKYIAYFLDRGEKFLPKWFYRSGIYFPMLKRIFAEEGVPQELIYLSLVESGLNPIARSWANAVGLWQFIKATGELYNLKGNIWTDDRRNPEKATRAAARHMKDLYDIYQDWYLVLAAYNSGGGKVNSAMRKGKSNDYWKISKFLPKETRGYVPQYIAISLIFMNPSQYGFDKLDIGKPFEFDTVGINECIDLSILSDCAGVDEETLTMMNPELVQGCTPPNTKYSLKIPKNKSPEFLAHLNSIPPDKKRLYFFHIVKKGETPQSISKKYKISKDLLVSLNNLDLMKRKKKRRNQIPVGIALKIPIKNGPKSELTSSNLAAKQDKDESTQTESKSSKNSVKTKLLYVVDQNDDLKKISSLYDVRISDIRNWNDIPLGQEVEASDTLEIWIPNNKISRYKDIVNLKSSEKQKLLSTKFNSSTESDKKWITHKVKKGETVSSISDKYDISEKSIKTWNKIKKNVITTGQKLKLYASITDKNSLIDKTQETKAKEVNYTVKEGETLFSIAKNNSIYLDDLKSWNDIGENNSLKAGQILRLIPKTERKEKTSLAANSKKAKADYHSYQVRKGDNLFSIAKAYNVKVDDIKKQNSISNESIKEGQILKISAANITSSKGDNAKSKTSGKKETYKIKKGDTLFGIAKKFNSTVADLQKWNDLKNGLIAGQKIILYR